MKTLKERVADRIRETVCHVCIFQRADGGCTLTGTLDCPILSRLDEIIDVVRDTHAETMDPFVERLRERVCSRCRMQDEQGHCALRNRAECALDDYYGLIVDLVEQEIAADAGRA